MGLEGIVSKRKASWYQSGRTRDWLKSKNPLAPAVTRLRRRGLGTIMVVKGKQETFAPVTLGHIRSHGCRDLLVHCISGRCHHSATLSYIDARHGC